MFLSSQFTFGLNNFIEPGLIGSFGPYASEEFAGSAGDTLDEIVWVKVPSIADQIGDNNSAELPPMAKGGIMDTDGMWTGGFMAADQAFDGMDAGGWSPAGTIGIDGSDKNAVLDDTAICGVGSAGGVAVPGRDTAITVNETTDAAANTSTSYSMSMGDTFAGTISAFGDNDWVAVNLTAGHAYQIALDGVTLGDAYLELYDSAGNLVDFNDDGGSGLNSLLNFTATTSGTYFISAGAYGNYGTGTYQMAIDEVAPPMPLDALDWGGTKVASNTVSVYFAKAGETYDGVTSDGWNSAQKNGVMQALSDIAEVTGLTFVRTTSAASATFKMVSTYNTGVDWSAYMNPPDQANPGVGVFNTANMDLNNLFRGSFDYFVIQHEAGHALGMAHPHDTGGGSVIMEGVSSAFDDYGLFNLNQAVFTMMSYNVGYDSVFPNVGDFGATVGPMAFDIALLQQKYGAPATALNNGNTVYDMPNANGTGTYFRCIWDDGGKDTIRYSGATDAIISLVAATLDYSPTGGGVVSYAAGIQGGFTIAHGVVIEHARGGRGNDDISGNAANNKLWGAAGRDSMVGDGGIDSLYGGNGNDQLSGGDGSDRLYGQNGADRLDGGGGNDRLFGGNGNDTLIGGAGLDDFIIKDNFGRDTIVDFNSANGNEDIDLSGVSSITSYNDLVNNHMTQVGLDAIINAGGGNILTILNTAIIALGIDDFIF